MSDRFVIACLLLTWLCGCAVDQKREVQLYRSPLDQSVAPPPAAGPAPQAMTLERAMRLANQLNEQLASRGEEYVQARIAQTRALTNFLPSNTADASYTFQDDRKQRVGNAVISNHSYQYSITNSGDLNLFHGFQDVSGLNEAKATSEQRRALLLDQQASLLLSVAQTYYAILASEQSIDVLNASLISQAERVRDTAARVRLGISRPLDLAQSRSDLAAAQVSLAQAKTDAATERETLAFLIGVARVDQPLADTFEPPVDSLPALAEQLRVGEARREDLLAAIHATVAAREAVNVAIGQYYPSINLDPTRILAQSSQGQPLWSIAFVLNVPSISDGHIQAEVRTAWSVYRQATLSESQVRRQVREEVAQARANLDGATDQLKSLADEVTAASEALRLSDRSYRLGSATYLERLTAQDSLLSAQLTQARERYAQKTYYLQLLRETGQPVLAALTPAASGTSKRPAKD